VTCKKGKYFCRYAQRRILKREREQDEEEDVDGRSSGKPEVKPVRTKPLPKAKASQPAAKKGKAKATPKSREFIEVSDDEMEVGEVEVVETRVVKRPRTAQAGAAGQGKFFFFLTSRSD
jgi:hypothetical protein